MKQCFTKVSLVATFLAGGLMFTACNKSTEESLPQDITAAPLEEGGSYIVVFKDEASGQFQARKGKTPETREEALEYARNTEKIAREEVSSLLRVAGIEKSQESFDHVYGTIFLGFAGELSAEEVKALKKDSRVALIERDQATQLEPAIVESIEDAGSAERNTQTTPWGITRVGGAVNAAGLSRWAWVIDSGIQLNHPDLTVNTQYSRSFVSGITSPTDGNGHGTHVAGTIAARNNTVGVIGVAAGATVVSIRVFDASGRGSNSATVAGVDYVASVALRGDVVNMSLGGGASSVVDNSVINAAAKGLYVAVAAGNSSANSNNFSPARVNYFNSSNGGKVITISAMDVNNRFASFSNFANPPIDFCAPGVSVFSTYLNGGYATLSGTSMATPHVAGIMLINNGTVRTNGRVLNDRDSNADLIAVR